MDCAVQHIFSKQHLENAGQGTVAGRPQASGSLKLKLVRNVSKMRPKMLQKEAQNGPE